MRYPRLFRRDLLLSFLVFKMDVPIHAINNPIKAETKTRPPNMIGSVISVTGTLRSLVKAKYDPKIATPEINPDTQLLDLTASLTTTMVTHSAISPGWKVIFSVISASAAVVIANVSQVDTHHQVAKVDSFRLLLGLQMAFLTHNNMRRRHLVIFAFKSISSSFA